MQAAIKYTITHDEYLAMDDTSEAKQEFYRGEIFAMAGGTFNHSAISCNVLSTLKVRLRGKSCQPMNSDMRVHTPSGLDTYPDISVYCGRPNLKDKQSTLLNPVVIIEVLSSTTRSYDRGDKFKLYRSITDLQDYVLIDSESINIEHFYRTENGEWILHEYHTIDESVRLAGAEVDLPLNEVYEDIAF